MYRWPKSEEGGTVLPTRRLGSTVLSAAALRELGIKHRAQARAAARAQAFAEQARGRIVSAVGPELMPAVAKAQELPRGGSVVLVPGREEVRRGCRRGVWWGLGGDGGGEGGAQRGRAEGGGTRWGGGDVKASWNDGQDVFAT